MMILHENIIFFKSTIRDVDLAEEYPEFVNKQVLNQTFLVTISRINALKETAKLL